MAGGATTFTDAYAQSPNWYSALVSILASRNFAISFERATLNAIRVEPQTIFTRLKTAGYQTSLFHSDLAYAKEDTFLAEQKLDVMAGGGAACLQAASRDGDGSPEVNDQCTVKALIDWVRAKKNERFAGLLWTS